MSQRFAFKLLSLIVLLSLAIQPIAPASAEPPQPPVLLTAAVTSPTAQATRAAASPLSEAVRMGKWPVQVAASTGAIHPDAHGPQRTDPAEGIPTHAYSPFDERRNREYPCPTGGCKFETDHVLVKLAPDVDAGAASDASAMTDDTTLNNTLSEAGVMRLEPLFPKAQAPKEGALIVTPYGERVAEPDLTRWYRAYLSPVVGLAAAGEGATQSAESAVFAAVEALSADPGVAWAEPDYLRKPVGEPRLDSVMESAASAASGQSSAAAGPAAFTDPLYAQQWHLGATHVPEAWQWLSDHGLPPGGSRDILVAVIDTGVSYTHPDLAANMWVNAVELNGISNFDDDGNGYKDDIYGADTVAPDGNPVDDHGHGTHVAGIIAAQANNGIGGVGVAYNVQIMAIKAAQYSGVLSASDIAEGVYYAVQKGADVINMSFGGYARSQVEEDALSVAFGTSVLVGAAGNDRKFNLPCYGGRDMYPAAYNWVLGVMASTPAGGRADFSNSDCVSHDTHEYELMAPGMDVWSTLPNGQYAAWDGTSMAAPVVSGIAALARTKWSDKDIYSSRFIMGQVAANASGGTGGVANAFTALTVPPRPEISYLEHWTFDTVSQDAGNDNDGIVDAGETVDLAIAIRNHWGKADPVSIKLEAWAEGAFQPDPYVTMLTDTVDYGAIGSFNQDDNGLIYDARGSITGVSHPFRFSVDPNTPNDHVIPFRLTMTAGNGYDPNDPNAPYTFVSRFTLVVQRGVELPSVISSDVILTKDTFWLVPNATLIEAGVTVTITEGAQLQFWSAGDVDDQGTVHRSFLQVDGNLFVQGSAERPVEFFPRSLNPGYPVKVRKENSGRVELHYVRILDPVFDGNTFPLDLIDHCYFTQSLFGFLANPDHLTWSTNPTVRANEIKDSIFRRIGYYDGGSERALYIMNQKLYGNLYDTSVVIARGASAASAPIRDNVFLKNYKQSGWVSALSDLGFTCLNCEPASGRASNIVFANAFLNIPWNRSNWMLVKSPTGRGYATYITDNYWGTNSTSVLDQMLYDYYDDWNLSAYVYQPLLTTAATTTYPFVTQLVLSTADTVSATVVGAVPVTFTVTFNRDMYRSVQPQVSFGPTEPCTDFTVHGDWTNARTWQGTFNIAPVTGDGHQLIRVVGAVAADDPWLVTGDDAGRFRFEIITSGTESMNLQATGGEGGVDLTWMQDDFDLLAGYNLYRSTSQSGTYTHVNSTIIPPEQKSWRDTNITPGIAYYYKFTVVKSDMTESGFSNVATGTPLDTIPPVISHTPIASATPGLPLALFADVTDNVGVQDVILHTRATGTTPYNSLAMVKTTGNRYSGTIAGAQVTAPGIDYYIEATDGISTVRNGRPEAPNVVAVVDRPVVTAISPNRGSASGGTALTIAGSNFKPGATATIGGAICGSLTVVSANQITCTTTPHFPAAADVMVTNPDAQSGSLLNGFIFESDTASLSLPATGGEQGALVQVPVNAANANGLAAASLTVTFDPAVLSARAATTGSLTPGWGLVANTTTAGQVRLSMASTGGTVAGSGVLAYIEFEVIGAAGTSSALTLSAVSLNDGAIPADTAAGSFAVNAVYSVAGTVRFWNGGAGVPGVALTLAGDRLYTGLSNAAGAYTVSGARADDYILTPAKSDGVAGISAYDASLALQHDAGLITLAGNPFTAGDVNQSGAVTSMDAFYILQKVVDLIMLPFPGAGVIWNLAPASRAYSNLNANQTGQDFTAVLLGDISGNWAASLAAASVGTPAGAPSLYLRGGRPDAAGFVTATLYLDSSEAPVYSLDLTLEYDANAVSPADISAGSGAAGALAQANLAEPGVIRLALAGATPLSSVDTAEQSLAALRFRLLDPPTRAGLTLRAGVVNESTTNLDWHAQPLNPIPVYLPLLVR